MKVIPFFIIFVLYLKTGIMKGEQYTPKPIPKQYTQTMSIKNYEPKTN